VGFFEITEWIYVREGIRLEISRELGFCRIPPVFFAASEAVTAVSAVWIPT
jgi:hypothetical protein